MLDPVVLGQASRHDGVVLGVVERAAQAPGHAARPPAAGDQGRQQHAAVETPGERQQPGVEGDVELGARREDGVAPALQVHLVRERLGVSVERFRHAPRRPCSPVEGEHRRRRHALQPRVPAVVGAEGAARSQPGDGDLVEAQVAEQADQRPLRGRGEEEVAVEHVPDRPAGEVVTDQFETSGVPAADGVGAVRSPGPGRAPAAGAADEPAEAHRARRPREVGDGVDDGDDETRLLDDERGARSDVVRRQAGGDGPDVLRRERQVDPRVGRRRRSVRTRGQAVRSRPRAAASACSIAAMRLARWSRKASLNAESVRGGLGLRAALTLRGTAARTAPSACGSRRAVSGDRSAAMTRSRPCRSQMRSASGDDRSAVIASRTAVLDDQQPARADDRRALRHRYRRTQTVATALKPRRWL